MTYVYLARPLDQNPERDQMGVTGRIKDAFAGEGLGVYDPGQAFTTPPDTRPTAEFARVNAAALAGASGVFAILPPGVGTYGVPIEIDRAVAAGKPTVIVGGENSWSLAEFSDYPHVRRVDLDHELSGAVRWLLGAIADRTVTIHNPLPFASVREPGPHEAAGRLPKRAYADDCGYDLVVSQSVTVDPGQFVDVPCNLAVELPSYLWGLIVGRSSTLRRKSLHVHPGVIDPGYRGELFAAVTTIGDRSVLVEAGERLAQLIPMSNHAPTLEPVLVQRLSESDRGTRGFGSSGS